MTGVIAARSVAASNVQFERATAAIKAASGPVVLATPERQRLVRIEDFVAGKVAAQQPVGAAGNAAVPAVAAALAPTATATMPAASPATASGGVIDAISDHDAATQRAIANLARRLDAIGARPMPARAAPRAAAPGPSTAALGAIRADQQAMLRRIDELGGKLAQAQKAAAVRADVPSPEAIRYP